MSPDGKQIAVVIEGPEDSLWVLDIQSGTPSRLTSDMDVSSVEWSPDGRSLFLTGNADGPRSIYKVAADGSGKPELVFRKTEWWTNDLSPRPDGSGVLFAAQDVGGHDIVFVREGSQKAEPFLATPSDERQEAFSPSGVFVAYTSNESGRNEVYVRPFPGPGPKRQVSTSGGIIPSWSRDGREIFYWQPDQVGRLMKVAFDPGDAKLSRPQPLFEVPLAQVDTMSLMPGNQQFVMVEPVSEETSPLLIVVIPSFLDEMKGRLAGKRP